MLLRTKRISYYDTLKAILIVLVVFGHTLELLPFTPAVRTTYSFIYSFHMPLFLFACGIFAKWNGKKALGSLLVFLLFSTVQILFGIFVANPLRAYTVSEVWRLFVYPQWGAWFLLAYAAYLCTVRVIKKPRLWHIFAAFCVALAIGFVPSIDEYLSLSRIFYFFPFFMLGRWCGERRERFNGFITKLQSGKHAPLVFVLALFVLFATGLTIFLCGEQITKSFFYGKYAYASYGSFGRRALCLMLALLNGFSVLLLIPMQSNDKAPIALIRIRNVLGKSTFGIYLFHILFLMVFKHYYAPYVLVGEIALLSTIVLTVLLLHATSIHPLRKSANFLLNGFSKAY